MKRVLLGLGSLRLTFITMLALAATALLSHDNPDIPILWVSLPLLLLAINLITAILSNERFHRQHKGLLVFHLGLLGVIIMAALGLMTSLDARLQITEGQSFDPENVEIVNQGPWHRNRLEQINFTQGKVKIDYVSAISRGRTHSQIWLESQDKKPQPMVIGDGVTLKSEGYRFITTGNKGYSVILSWMDEAGGQRVGAVNMPSFPMFEWKQENSWTTPAGQTLTLSLLDNSKGNQDADAAWTMDSDSLQARLLVSENGREHVLDKGGVITLERGELRFEAVHMWIGYRIDSNPLLLWLFIASLIAITGLGYYFWQKFSCPPIAVSNTITKVAYGSPVRG